MSSLGSSLNSPTLLLPTICPGVKTLSVKEPSGFCALFDKAVYWSKVVNIGSVISVNMAAPSPIMCPVLTGDTTLMFYHRRICSCRNMFFLVRGQWSTVRGRSYPNHRVFCHSCTQSYRGHP